MRPDRLIDFLSTDQGISSFSSVSEVENRGVSNLYSYLNFDNSKYPLNVLSLFSPGHMTKMADMPI